MRLFLDAHISGRRVAHALRQEGHDVHAADEERELDGMTDEELLTLALAEDRIFVTFDVADFPRITQRWAEQGRTHSGCAIIVGIDHREFGTMIRVIVRMLDARRDPEDWRDYTCFIGRR